MSDTLIERSIVQAVGILVDSKTKQLKKDITVEANIYKGQDRAAEAPVHLATTANGQKIYYVKYLGVAYKAASQKDEDYQDGQAVRVLVPEGDWSKNPIILGRSWIYHIDEEQNINVSNAYDLNGLGAIFTYDNVGLQSQLGEDHEFTYQYDQQGSQSSITKKIAESISYIHSSDSLLISTIFQNSLDPSQQAGGGTYGVRVVVAFKTGENTYTQKTYEVNQSSYTQGNPYVNGQKFLQKLFSYEPDLGRFDHIKSIAFFAENFPATATINPPVDLRVLKFSLNGVNMIPQAELSDYSVRVQYPLGNTVKTYTAEEGEVDQSDIYYQGILKFNGTPITSGFTYYWFCEDPNFTKSSLGYDSRIGQGWKPLNKLNAENKAIGLSNGIFHFTYKQDSTQIAYSEINGYYVIGENSPQKMNLLCLVEWNKETSKYWINKENTVYFLDKDRISWVINNSDIKDNENRTVYYFGEGSPTLTMELKEGSAVLPPAAGATYIYNWYKEDSTGARVSLTPIENNELNPNQIIFPIAQIPIDSYVIIIGSCIRTYQGQTEFFGSANIKLFNSSDIPSSGWSIRLNGGEKTYQYNQDGSIAIPDNQITFSYEPLTITLYDGGELESYSGQNVINNGGTITWEIPNQNTLLTNIVAYGVDGSIISKEEKSGFDIYENAIRITYELGQYNLAYINNSNISVQVYYNNNAFFASTNFYFPKNGDPGTNGTNTIMQIKALDSNSNVISTDRVYARINNNSVSLQSDVNNGIITDISYLQSKLYRNNSEIDLSGVARNYQMLEHFSGVGSNFGVSSSSSQSIAIIKNQSSGGNDHTIDIVRSSIDYLGLTFYSELPICYYSSIGNTSYRLKIKRGTGFSWVTYSEAGINPVYGGSTTFVAEVYKLENNVWVLNNDSRTYTWLAGNGLNISSSDGNTAIVYADNVLKVQDSLNSYIFVRCTNPIIVLRIPVYRLFNRYSHKNFNSWDGNSIKISETGGYILSPQVGAGHKTNNTFTGILIGQVGKQQNGNITSETGLFGYNQGVRTIFLNANSGVAKFGRAGFGQIVIDGEKAKITGGTYSTSAKTGMQIDLAKPHIIYGNKKFSVDENGILTATGANVTGTIHVSNGGSIGELQITESRIYAPQDTASGAGAGMNGDPNTTASTIKAGNYADGKAMAFWAGSGTGNAKPFYVTLGGYLKSTSGNIGGWNISNNLTKTYTTSSNIDYQVGLGEKYITAAKMEAAFGTTSAAHARIWGTTDNSDDANLRFILARGGTLYAKNAYISGTIHATSGMIGNWEISTSDGVGFLESVDSANNRRIYFTPKADATNALAIGTRDKYQFRVTPAGILHATGANISGTITTTSGSKIAGMSATDNALKAGYAGMGTLSVNNSVLRKYPGWEDLADGSTTLRFWGTSNGTADATHLKFGVTAAGTLFAEGVHLKGNITATSGSFTGHITATSGSFTGSITANQGKIANWDISSTKLTYSTTGMGSNMATRADLNEAFKTSYSTSGADIRLSYWAGSNTDNSKLKFAVSTAGTLYATGAYINGTINATAGTFKNVTIDNSCTIQGNLDAAQITTGTLNVARIPNLNASKITAGTMNVKRLYYGGNGSDDVKWNLLSYCSALTYNQSTKILSVSFRSCRFLTSSDTWPGDSASWRIG